LPLLLLLLLLPSLLLLVVVEGVGTGVAWQGVLQAPCWPACFCWYAVGSGTHARQTHQGAVSSSRHLCTTTSNTTYCCWHLNQGCCCC
jgi:hypothetical protein